MFDLKTLALAQAIGGGGSKDLPKIHIGYSQLEYGLFGYNRNNEIIEKAPDMIVMQDVYTLNCAFYESSELVDASGLKINWRGNSTDEGLGVAFSTCLKLEKLPKLINLTDYIPTPRFSSTFKYCYRLTEDEIVPFLQALTANNPTQEKYSYSTSLSDTFNGCSSILDFSAINKELCKIFNMNSKIGSISGLYYNTYCGCYQADNISNIPVLKNYVKSSGSVNVASGISAFSELTRASVIEFEMEEDGTPCTLQTPWQTIIDVSQRVGYDLMNHIGDNRGVSHPTWRINLEHKVVDDATYQQYKGYDDWYTNKQEYSRYNHDGAVRTINSLPFHPNNQSTIRFAGANGSKTDGGAINTLTADEIAVAAAKGWTVSIQ